MIEKMILNMNLLTKIQYVFNKILLNLLKEIKDKDSKLKINIKQNYAVFDKSSNSHIMLFINNDNTNHLFTTPYEEKDLLLNDSIQNFEILKDIKLSEILNVIDVNEKDVIKCYLYIFYMLSHIYKKTLPLDESDDVELTKMNDLFNKCVKMIKNDEHIDYEEEMDNIFDDDLTIIFKNIYESRKHIKDSMMNYNNGDLDGPEQDSPFDFLQNSKIGQLAQEITQDIDISNLNIKDPSELLNIESMFSGENNVLGDIISKVGNKVAAKISSGELKHEDLLGEAMSMMGKLNMGGNGAFMEEMMKTAMKSQHPNSSNSSSNSSNSKTKAKHKRINKQKNI